MTPGRQAWQARRVSALLALVLALSARADGQATLPTSAVIKSLFDVMSMFVPLSVSNLIVQPESPEERLESLGYGFEAHNIVTDDGYRLMVHRIPNPNKPPVLFLHGIFASSYQWLLAGRGRSLPLLMHDAGYDVWLGNFRGSPYTAGHLNISAKQPKFWKFSFHEMGTMDAAKMLEMIYDTTGKRVKVYAYSMASSSVLALLSERPEYHDLIEEATLLAPMVSYKGVSPTMARYLSFSTVLLELMGVSAFILRAWQTRLMSLLCHPEVVTNSICKQAYYAVSGISPEQFDPEILPRLFVAHPTDTSLQTLVHLSQCIAAKNFVKFKSASADDAELYNLSKVEGDKITVVYADNDLLSGALEGEWLKERLGPKSRSFKVQQEWFSHLDFLYGKNTKLFLFDPILHKTKAHNQTATTGTPSVGSSPSVASSPIVGSSAP